MRHPSLTVWIELLNQAQSLFKLPGTGTARNGQNSSCQWMDWFHQSIIRELQVTTVSTPLPVETRQCRVSTHAEVMFPQVP